MQTKNGAIWDKKIVSFFFCFVPLHWIWNGNRLNSVYAWMHAYWKWWMLWCLKYISSSVLFTFTLCTTLPQIVCIRFISLLHPLSVSLETHSLLFLPLKNLFSSKLSIWYTFIFPFSPSTYNIAWVLRLILSECNRLIALLCNNFRKLIDFANQLARSKTFLFDSGSIIWRRSIDHEQHLALRNVCRLQCDAAMLVSNGI